MKYKTKVSWWIARSDLFSVEAIGWCDSNKWHYNVYGYIFETNRLFNKVDFVLDHAPLHHGPTLDDVITTEPARGIRYKWQKAKKTFKFGSDYNHYTDKDHSSAFEGIPYYVENDAQELAKWLEAHSGKEGL